MRRTRRVVAVSVLLVACVAFLLHYSSRLSAAPSSTTLGATRAWLAGLGQPAQQLPALKKIELGRIRLAQSGSTTGTVEPWVSVDKRDYQPGETAQITGGGFDGDVTIWLKVEHADPTAVDTDPDHHLPWPVAVSDGTFESSWYVEPSDSVGQEYVVTATGDPSGREAEVRFTDAALASLDQCANDPAPSSHNDGCNTSATQWVNGNLGASKSVYLEGDSIPYRLTFDGLSTTGSHTVTIEWDTTKSSKHAIDYITTFNRTVLNANPCLGVTGCSPGAFTTFAIPADTQVTGASVTPDAGLFTLYGGTITAVSAYTYPDGAGFAGDKSAQITITFTASVANPVLAWGGHIATRQNWGASNSAVAISGSPYHTRLIDTDGTGGNQDRSLSADAVIFPGSITIIKDATPNGATSFGFTGSPAPLTNFSLVDDGTSSNTTVFGNITTFQNYSVNESSIPSGWGFDSVSCSVTSPNGGSYSTSTTTANINMKEGENWSCTYLDSIRTGTLTVIKHVINDNGGTSTAANWSIHVKSGSNEVTGSPQAGSESGTSYTLAGGSYVASETGGPSGYTFTGFSGDCDSTGAVTVVAGQTKTCTLTNNDTAPALHLRKIVTNDNGGTKTLADFTLTADGTGSNDVSGTSPVDSTSSLKADTWALSETNVAGYSASAWSCVGGTQNGSNITLALGQEATCTITNNDAAVALTIVKRVKNDNGGNKTANDFGITSTAGTVTFGNGVSDNGFTKYTSTKLTGLSAGPYTLHENDVTGYTEGTWSCTGGTGLNSNFNTGSITLANGDDVTCTIDNDDQQGSLQIVKNIVNDNGGTVTTLTPFGINTTAGALTFGNAQVNGTTRTFTSQAISVNAGPYTLRENDVAAYTEGTWGCTGATPSNTSINLGSVTVPNGVAVVCTITNNDNPGTIIIRKNATPQTGIFTFTTTGSTSGGGTNWPASFTLTGSTSGGGNQRTFLVDTGTYTVTESMQLGWLLDAMGGDPNTPGNCVATGTSTGTTNLNDRKATINIVAGDTVTCVFENTGNGATRTQGFWATHSQLANIAWFGGDQYGHSFPGVAVAVGDLTICSPIKKDLTATPTQAAGLGRLMGGFWSDISKTSGGTKRTSAEQSRMQLIQQLLAAELNASAFGAAPSNGSFTAWENAYCSGTPQQVQTALQQAAAFNSQGDSSTFTPGTAADSKNARAIANIPYWDVVP